MLFKLVTAFILTLTLVSCSKISKTTASISGQVMGLVDDETLSGAVVTVMKGNQVVAKAVTDKNGYFRVHNLPEGKYDVIAEKGHYNQMKIDSMCVKKGNEVMTQFILTRVIPS